MIKQNQTIFTKLTFIGAAIKEGQSLEGVEEGPAYIRSSGLFQSLKQKFNVEIIDEGDFGVKQLLNEDIKQKVEHKFDNLHLLDPLLRRLHTKICKVMSEHPDSLTLTVGGDHSVATASISAVREHHKNLKVIWVDAHPDFIDSTLSDYYGYHGNPVAHLTGMNQVPGFEWLKTDLPMENVVFIAIRDIDADEWVNLKKHKIKCFTMDHVDQYGIGEVMRQAIEYLDKDGNAPFHISFDIDGIDPSLASATGTKFRGGLTTRQACHIVRRTANQRKLVSLDIMEINPKLETNGYRKRFRGEEQIHQQCLETVAIGVDLIESAFTQYLTLP